MQTTASSPAASPTTPNPASAAAASKAPAADGSSKTRDSVYMAAFNFEGSVEKHENLGTNSATSFSAPAASEEDELDLIQGQVVWVLKRADDGWCVGERER